MNNKIKHLEFIQGVINRLASDSFRMKGWCVVLVATLFILLALFVLVAVPLAQVDRASALLVLLARANRIEFIAAALIPVIAFWGLDGYFLWQERLYRALYDHVRTLAEAEIDFSMDISAFKTGRPRTWPSAAFSRTLLCFYGALALAVALAMSAS